jgi:hypothetical protein
MKLARSRATTSAKMAAAALGRRKVGRACAQSFSHFSLESTRGSAPRLPAVGVERCAASTETGHAEVAAHTAQESDLRLTNTRAACRATLFNLYNHYNLR